MAAPAARSKLRSLYRALLKELPARPILSTPRPPLQQYIRDHFQPQPAETATATTTTTTATVTTPTTATAVPRPSETLTDVAQAEQYLAYLRAQRTYLTLLERYNPGFMGVNEEERVRLTARRVGMELPVEYRGEGNEKE